MSFFYEMGKILTMRFSRASYINKIVHEKGDNSSTANSDIMGKKTIYIIYRKIKTVIKIL